jgi:hypothetical protein
MENDETFEFAHEIQFCNYLIDNYSKYFDFEIIGQEVAFKFNKESDINLIRKLKPKNMDNWLWIDLIGSDSKYFYIIEVKTEKITNSDIQIMKMWLRNFKTYKKVKGIFVVPKDKIQEKKILEINKINNIRCVEIPDVSINRKLSKKSEYRLKHDDNIELNAGIALARCKRVNHQSLKKFYVRNENSMILRYIFKNDYGINLEVYYRRYESLIKNKFKYDYYMNYEVAYFYSEDDYTTVKLNERTNSSFFPLIMHKVQSYYGLMNKSIENILKPIDNILKTSHRDRDKIFGK